MHSKLMLPAVPLLQALPEPDAHLRDAQIQRCISALESQRNVLLAQASADAPLRIRRPEARP